MIIRHLSASTIVMALVSMISWTPAVAQDTTIRTKKQAGLHMEVLQGSQLCSGQQDIR